MEKSANFLLSPSPSRTHTDTHAHTHTNTHKHANKHAHTHLRSERDAEQAEQVGVAEKGHDVNFVTEFHKSR